jgi:ATP-dependent helicase HrpA
MTFRVEDEKGRTLAEGKDLPALQRRLAPAQRQTMAAAARSIERSGLTAWPGCLPGGEIPRTFTTSRDGLEIRGFPALVDTGAAVDLRVLASAEQQRREMWAGTRRLLLLALASPTRQVLGRLDNATKLALAAAPHGSGSALFDDALTCAVDSLMAQAGWMTTHPPGDQGSHVRSRDAWSAAAFDRLLDAVRPALPSRLTEVLLRVAEILTVAGDVDRRLRATTSLSVLSSVADIRAHRDRLVYPGFVTATGFDRLRDVVRYLRADVRRLETLPERPGRDRDLLARVVAVEDEHARRLAGVPDGEPVPASLAEIGWMIEEFRVSLFAQPLGTAYPVSEKRISKAMSNLL